MKTNNQAEVKAQEYLSSLPSGWIIFTYQIEPNSNNEDAGEWFFTLVKGPITLFPKENCTKWIARIGERLGVISGPWETKGDSITMMGAL